MTDTVDRGTRSRIMAAIGPVSGAETRARPLALRLAGCRLRQWGDKPADPRAPGKPDFYNLRRRVAVLFMGCFWHGCPRHFRPPAANRRFWLRKIRANRARDRRVVRGLRALGWAVHVIWGHDHRLRGQFLLKGDVR